MKLSKTIILVALVFLLALSLRLPSLGSVMTVDETNWMMRSELFYDKMMRLDPGGTFVTTHPGSTAMILIGAGITAQEFRLGTEATENNLLHFRKAAVFPVVLATSLLIALITYLLIPLFNKGTAITAGVLLAADPYLTGMSQIAHLDALQALLMLSSLLAFLLSLKQKTNPTKLLILAGVMGGLAMGVKLVLALWLGPILLLVLLLRKYRWQTIVKRLAFTGGLAIFIFWLTWPALWVKDDVAKSFTRDVATVITDEHVQLTNKAEESISPKSFYLRTWLGRVPPHIQVLSLFALVIVTFSSRFSRSPRKRREVYYLFVYALGFLILITFAAKKADRYAMPALVVFPVLSAWVANIAAGYILPRLKSLNMSRALVTLTGLAVVGLPLLWSPHAIAYNNPIFPSIRPLSQQGWGEGLEAAASWLNEQPLAKNSFVASWYPTVTKTYFDGGTFSLSSRDDLRVGYVINYRNMQGRAGDTQASNVWDEYKNKEPEKIIEINGEPYAWIYKTVNVGHFLKHVGEVIGVIEVGQTVFAETEEISAIEIGFATFSSRANDKDVIIHVRDNISATSDLRTATINAADIVDNEWHSVEFPALKVDVGQKLFVSVTSPSSIAGNAITVRFIAEDIQDGEMVLRREALGSGKTNADYVRVGDAAIRIKQD